MFAKTEAFWDNEPSETEAMAMFRELHARALAMGLQQHQFGRLKFVSGARKARWTRARTCFKRILLVALTLALSFSAICFLEWPLSNQRLAEIVWRVKGGSLRESQSERCLVRASSTVQNLARPPIDCDFCEGVTSVAEVTNISQQEFMDTFAYSGQPVVVSDGCVDWSAVKVFSFDFFKNLYEHSSYDAQAACQFFPYQTEFTHLHEVFEMDENRVHLRSGSKPWYVGWSNCDTAAGGVLRQHYGRPYFLPPQSESSNTDWMFMGSPGYGAHMHVDNVGLPSWQAQIKGRKTWVLQPPPECYFRCVNRMHVTVTAGAIIVLNTNKWYHSTLVEGEDISITIGSEYD